MEENSVSSPRGVGVADHISVDRRSASVGDIVLVSWEIRTRAPHERDFIGMFEVAESATQSHVTQGDDSASNGMRHMTMDGLLDSRVRGDTSVSGGQLQWILQEDLFPGIHPTYIGI